ncbi:response regulator receiver domain protein [Synechococcus sp. PCC 7335]|uniref:response regulator transcription factor n=1 Tax=Synechococcus sp. (strain ATCC 29403 / PCC 7335) TaxID=91464 RepID=UPI00017EBBD5|nr:response regulator transcription factor [Synechococcus sp. PCC 7335]EDX84724.1 response regulator receiver domain protein [Synechococcus sp. PCC 7335]
MRILLVDDEVELTDPLSHLLRRQGYSVDVASDGETGAQMAISGQYDLLILDRMLSKMSGLEICQKVRSQALSTPVLFLTAKDTLDDRVDGLDAGADDYLVKPFELRELLARVRALLRRPGSPSVASPSILQFEDLKLQVENQLVSRNGKSIELSDKEVQLLAYLMRSPHQLLTHAQIYDAVWGEGSAPSSNTLAAQMRLLRKKIEQPGQPVLIHTVYGKGYRLGSAA